MFMNLKIYPDTSWRFGARSNTRPTRVETSNFLANSFCFQKLLFTHQCDDRRHFQKLSNMLKARKYFFLVTCTKKRQVCAGTRPNNMTTIRWGGINPSLITSITSDDVKEVFFFLTLPCQGKRGYGTMSTSFLVTCFWRNHVLVTMFCYYEL